MSLFYYTEKYLSEMFHAGESHRSGVAGYAPTFLRCLVSNVSLLLNRINK